jgi:membrane-bound metal-dependent hydrolase YbcI (DUF457 family)
MSGFVTHALIGAVGGLALSHVLGSAAASSLEQVAGVSNLPGIVTMSVSAVLALWPDIDEGDSWISHRARTVIVIVTVILGALGGWLWGQSDSSPPLPALALALAGAALGLLAGPLLGGPVLRLVHKASGGHRHLTHSLTLALVLGVAAWLGWLLHSYWLAIVPAALVWGELLHLIGDVVTPAGVPLWYPFSRHWARLPHPISVFGEPLVFAGALAVGAFLLYI